ncbi:TPA: hypothetical protein DF272_01545 [Candidatus Falkowbacteria bacterium]|nr:hypothetical protein [Candidatus Falkowbacteria bacterium]
MKYSVATNWKPALVENIASLNRNHQDQVTEIFGSLAFSIFGSARSVPGVPEISKQKFTEQLNNFKTNGIKFNYLVNSSTFPNLNLKENQRRAHEYFDWITSLKPEIVTVGNRKTLEFISRNFPTLSINLSIVLALKTVLSVNDLREKYSNITRVTLHQTVNRQKSNLIAHLKNAHKKNKKLPPIEVELLANEICLFNCPRMKSHYNYLSQQSQTNRPSVKPFEPWCGRKRRDNPLNFLNAPFIRPEDIETYENLGVDMIKIAGRGESTAFLTRSIEAYLSRHYAGNIMNLTYPDCWPDNKRPTLDNRKLDGFLEYLWRRGLTRLASIPSKYPISY